MKSAGSQSGTKPSPNVHAGTQRANPHPSPKSRVVDPDPVTHLERRFSQTFEVSHPVLVRTAAEGFLNLLLALELDDDAEIVLPVSICQTMVNAVLLAGHVPVLADCDHRFALTPDALITALSERTRLVVVHHPFGLVQDLSDVVAICHRRGLVLVEDCAQSLGARPPQTATPIPFGLTSFGPGKPLDGDGGGMVWCSDAEQARRLRLAARSGAPGYPDDQCLGWPSLPTENQWQTLAHALEGYPDHLRKRTTDLWQGINALQCAGFQLQLPDPHESHVFHRVLITVNPEPTPLPIRQLEALQQALPLSLRPLVQTTVPTPTYAAPFLGRKYRRHGRVDLYHPDGVRFPRYRVARRKALLIKATAAWAQGLWSELVLRLAEGGPP